MGGPRGAQVEIFTTEASRPLIVVTRAGLTLSHRCAPVQLCFPPPAHLPQGKGVADALLARGPDRFRVRIVTRNPDGPAAKALAARGAEVALVSSYGMLLARQ